MNEPTFDYHGYPTDETLGAIKNWPIDQTIEWLDFIKLAWSSYGRIWIDKEGMHCFVTGGWSGNESIACAMQQNILWTVFWVESRRGGFFKFEIPAAKDNQVIISREEYEELKSLCPNSSGCCCPDCMERGKEDE